jgi:DNA replication initiation complex subunit (GINS family)
MLQDLLRAERRSNKLMAVPARFWPMVREFLDLVTQAFRIEQAKDPFSRKVMMLSDQVKNAKHAAESLWALRERKLAMLALAATKDRKIPDGVTPDEGALFHDMVGTLEEARNRVFEGTISAPSLGSPPLPVPSASPEPTAPPPVQMPVVEVAAASQAVMPAPVQVPHDTMAAPPAMTTIRALSDLPPFVGPDMQTYTLKAGDIATVPPSIASLLVRRNKAAVVDA